MANTTIKSGYQDKKKQVRTHLVFLEYKGREISHKFGNATWYPELERMYIYPGSSGRLIAFPKKSSSDGIPPEVSANPIITSSKATEPTHDVYMISYDDSPKKNHGAKKGVNRYLGIGYAYWKQETGQMFVYANNGKLVISQIKQEEEITSAAVAEKD